MTEKKIASIVRNRYNRLYQDHVEIFDEVETYHQMYRASITTNESWGWDYELVDPVVFYLVRSMLSKMNPESFRIRLEARNSGDETNREINQQIINWELQEMEKTLTFYKFIFRGILAGRAYLKTGWLFNKALKIKRNGREEKVMRDIINRADAKNIRFQDIIVPNRNIPRIEEQPYIIERMMIRFGEMIDRNETEGREFWKNKYLEEILKKKMWATKVDYGLDLFEMDDGGSGKKKNNKIEASQFERAQYVSVLRMQTLDGDIYYTPSEGNDWILNTEQGNEYWHGEYPYITWTPFPEDDEFFSMGAVQPIADLQIALTSTLNQYLTNIRKSGNPMWVAGQGAAQTPDWMFVNRPDGVIRVNGDPNQILPVRSPDVSDTMITMRREVMTSFERTSGMSSMFATGVSSGNTPQLNKTATGARIIDANIESHMQMMITLLGSQAIIRLGEQFLALNAQYITEEQQLKINDRTGVKYVNIEPSEVTANFDVIANADTLTKENPVVRQAQLLNLKGLIDAEKEVKFDKKPIWKSILASFPEMDGIDDVILDPEQQAKDAITDLLSGVEPPIPINMDHKSVLQLVQVFMLSNPNMPDEQVKLFTEYIDALQKYIESKKVLFTMESQLMPTNPDMLSQQMGAESQGGIGPLPSDESSLMKSLTSQNQAVTNPTNDLPFKLPEEMMT
jgi:hypothetical protein